MSLLLAPESAPFFIAAAILVALTVIEVMAMVIGFSFSDMLGDPIDSHDGLSWLFSWFNVGGVPILILVMLFLGIFAISGLLIQMVASQLYGLLPAGIAATLSVICTIPLTRHSTRAVARIVPRDETYAVDLTELVGRTGQVTVGPLDQGLPGQVQLKDAHGNWHTVRACAARGEAAIPVRTIVLLVDRTKNIFTAIVAPPDLQAATDHPPTEH